MKISVLDASSDGTAYENFSRVLDRTERFDVKEKEFPDDPDAVLVTGSRYAVYDDRDWIRPLLEKIREFSHDVPLMGVCFGHQAIAKALGGEVRHMGSYEIGYRQIRLGTSRIFDDMNSVEYPFSTHEDEVVSLPENFQKTAESDESIHGFEHREEHIYGIQFHPEFDLESVKDIIRDKDISQKKKEALMEEAEKENHRQAEKTQKALRNFEEIVEKEKS
ncbi:MAG: type 1 glutamine amidotransferase [Candidatus Nanohalobium sp.]